MSLVDDFKGLNADKLLFKAEKSICVPEEINNSFNYKKILLSLLLILCSLILISKLAFALTPPTGGITYYNFSSVIDLWGSDDATNNGADSVGSYPSFAVSGDSAPNSFDFVRANSDYVTMTANDRSDNFTYSLWAYADSWSSTSAENNFFEHIGSGTTGILIGWSTTQGQPQAVVHDGVDWNFLGTTSVTSGAWHHYVVTYDGSVVRYYIDGISVVNNTQNVLTSLTSDKKFGRYASDFFDGKIDEYKEFDRAISHNEVNEIYNYGSITPPSPVYSHYESAFITEQVGTTRLGSTGVNVTILSESLEVQNITEFYGDVTVQMYSPNNAGVYCYVLGNGNVIAQGGRNNLGGTYGSLTLNTGFGNLTNASINVLDLKCQKTSGSWIDVVHTDGVAHLNTNNVTQYTQTISNSSVTLSNASLLDDSVLVPYNGTAIVEWSNSITNNEASTQTIITQLFTSEGSCGFFNRTVNSGFSGSTGGGCAFPVTSGDHFNASLYVTGSNIDISHKPILKFVSSPVNYTSISSRVVGTSPVLLESFSINNSDGSYDNVYLKNGVSVQDTSNDVYFFFSVGGVNTTAIPKTASSGAEVQISQALESVSSGVINLSLYAYSDTGTASINGGDFLAYLVSDFDTNATFFNVTAYDSWDNSSINNFSVSYDGATISTTSGVVKVFTANITSLNFTINSSTHFNYSVTNHNVSTNLNQSLNQSIINFSSKQYITNNTLTGVSYYIDGITSNYFNLKAGSYNVTTVKSEYYNLTQEITINALDNKTINITGLYNNIINVSAYSIFTGSAINNFTFNPNISSSVSTTNGSLYVPNIQGYNVSYVVSNAVYTTQNGSLIANSTYNNLSVGLYDFNSVRIEIYNGTTSNLLTQNVRIEVINSVTSFNVSTSTGKYNLSLLQPLQHELRFTSSGFNPQSYFVTVTNDSTSLIKIYMNLNTSNSPQLVRILDIGGDVVSGAIVWLQEQVINASPQWVTTQQGETNFLGETVFYVERDTSIYYRFAIIYDGSFVPISPTNELYTSKTFFLPGVDGIENEVIIIVNTEATIDNDITIREELVTNGGITGVNNETVWCSWADPNNAVSGAKIVVIGKYLQTNFSFEEVYSASSSLTSGNLTYTFPIINNTIYDTNCYILWSDSEENFFSKISDFGNDLAGLDKNTGILYAILIVLACALLTLQFGAMGSGIFTILALFVVKGLGLMNIPVTVITTFLAIVIIGFVGFKRR